jgi:hypothetical protein
MAHDQNVFKVEVQALDSGFGYQMTGLMIVAGVRTEINEHYDLESEVGTRLQSGWTAWAAQVDSE